MTSMKIKHQLKRCPRNNKQMKSSENRYRYNPFTNGKKNTCEVYESPSRKRFPVNARLEITLIL